MNRLEIIRYNNLDLIIAKKTCMPNLKTKNKKRTK